MTIPALPSGLQPEDFEKIEAAVMETARGRWFLLEYARRQRAEETGRLLQAIERLERRVAGVEPAPPEIGRAADSDVAVICEPEGSRSMELALDREPSGSQSGLRQGAPARLLLTTAAAGPIEPPADPRLVALSRLDHLPLAEKLALFS
jgi:hypothetical protein